MNKVKELWLVTFYSWGIEYEPNKDPKYTWKIGCFETADVAIKAVDQIMQIIQSGVKHDKLNPYNVNNCSYELESIMLIDNVNNFIEVTQNLDKYYANSH